MPKFFLTFLMICIFGPAFSQVDSLMPLKGKTVAVYFSKRQFTFDNNYRIPLSQFIRSDMGHEAAIEDIKTQTLISLGALFSSQLAACTEADSVFFLNENPDLARPFIQGYDAYEHSLSPLGESFADIDYVMVMNPLILGSYTTSAVFTRSNRLITERIINKTARVHLELFDTKGAGLLTAVDACFDERKTPVPQQYFEFHMEHSITGTFLARLFSLAVFHMNYGLESNCEVE